MSISIPTLVVMFVVMCAIWWPFIDYHNRQYKIGEIEEEEE